MVRTNAAGPWMERSTCDSAAKWTTAPRTVLGEQAIHERPVADVAAREEVAGVAAERSEALEVAGVRELVEVQDGRADLAQPVEDEVGADEARASGDDDHTALLS